MEIVDDGGFIEVCELGHVVGFVELGWVDLVDALAIYFALLYVCQYCISVLRWKASYPAVVTLYQEQAAFELLNNPSFDKC